MEDLISRQAALDVVNDCGICIQKIFDLPSAEPKKGKWVQTNPPERSDNIVCDQCGYDSIAKFIYCPNCGAKMEVTE